MDLSFFRRPLPQLALDSALVEASAECPRVLAASACRHVLLAHGASALSRPDGDRALSDVRSHLVATFKKAIVARLAARH